VFSVVAGLIFVLFRNWLVRDRSHRLSQALLPEPALASGHAKRSRTQRDGTRRTREKLNVDSSTSVSLPS